MSKKEPLFQSTAAALLAYITQSGITELPSLHELSVKFRVGQCTMQHAVLQLEHDGLVSCHRGRTTRVLSKAGIQEPGRDTLSKAAQRLLRDLRQEILDIKRKPGLPLPKVEYLATKLRISHGSIAQVFRRLQVERLIHKAGKKWVVGPPDIQVGYPAQTKPVLGKDAPVVIILCTKLSLWYEIERSDRCNIFAYSLFDELMKYRFRMVICGADSSENGPVSPSGIQNVERYIRQLGDRYMGTIIVPHLYPAETGISAKDWLAMLDRAGKPVVWCDIYDMGAQHLNRGEAPSGMGLFVIPQNNKSAISTVLDTLVGQGHEKIGMPYLARTDGKAAFSNDRMDLCTEIIKREYPAVQFVPVEINGPLLTANLGKWYELREWTDYHKLINFFKTEIIRIDKNSLDNSVKATGPSRNEIAATMPFLSKIIAQDGVTAVIAPNDVFASQFFVWFSLLNIDIPNDISMVSFDNSSLIRPYPIATIDWGYSHTAYCAFHLLVGDIQISRNSEGIIMPFCTLIDRGSIAPPRRRNIVF